MVSFLMKYLNSFAMGSPEEIEIGSGSESSLANEHFSAHVSIVELLQLLVIRMKVDEIHGYGHGHAEPKDKAQNLDFPAEARRLGLIINFSVFIAITIAHSQ